MPIIYKADTQVKNFDIKLYGSGSVFSTLNSFSSMQLHLFYNFPTNIDINQLW